MNHIRKHIPNTLTCFNLAFGFIACIMALEGLYFLAMTCVFISVGFDFMDGLAARLLHAYSPIGKDLDSLADMVSFGVAPGLMLFGFINELIQKSSFDNSLLSGLFYIGALAIPVFSGLRLAKFNNDTRQTTSFIGLPVPAHAIFWASLINALSPAYGAYGQLFPGTWLSDLSNRIDSFVLPTILAVSAIATSLLLVSEIPMFSLKIKSLAWKGNEQRYLLILAAIILTVCLGTIGLTATILLYILLSVFNRHT